MDDLRDELRNIGCHANGGARCTCGIGQDALALIDRLTAERDALAPWARLGLRVMQEWPEYYDIDGFDLQEMAEAVGVLKRAQGGFDPEKHEDVFCAAEPGDDWFTIINKPAIPDTPA